MKDYTIQYIFSASSLIFSYIFGNCNTILICLLLIMLLDYATGILQAIYNKNLNSHVGYKGIIKKILILIFVGLANLIDKSLEVEMCRNIVIFFYIANESLSIIENFAKCDMIVPKKIITLLEQLRDKNDKEEE